MKKLGVFLLIVVFVQMASSVHWINGSVEDALDGEGVDGKSVVMWNPAVGVSDNLTDVVNATGAYEIDCEMLSAGCLVNDILSLRIFGGVYISWIVNVTVTAASFDTVGNLSLNSPASVDLIFPEDSDVVAGDARFNCSFFDYDDNVDRVSLWGNWSGSFIEEDFVTSGFGDGYIIFNENLAQGDYLWNCYARDELGIGSFGVSNNSFFVDTTSPVIAEVSSVTDVCGFGTIPVDCNVSDNVAIGDVVIQVISPTSVLVNYSAAYVSGNIYRANVSLDEVGDWGLTCFANDSAGNVDLLVGSSVKVGSGNPEVGFVGGVDFERSPGVEGEVINVSVNVSNLGCVGTGNFVVGFFDDGVSFDNVTISLGSDGYSGVISGWLVDIGSSGISVYADLDDVLTEDNESNNVVNGSAWLGAWQDIYGNVSLDIILAGDENKLGNWSGMLSFVGNIFVADSEAIPEWGSLQAVGRDKTGLPSVGDFGEIDSLLDMGSFNDSIALLYGSADVGNFSVFGVDIENVAYVNSSFNGAFSTGILWDMSDSVDDEYDSSEREDVVFVSKVNVGAEGDYGFYDYEIMIPSKLRGYDSGDESKIYLYYDLV